MCITLWDAVDAPDLVFGLDLSQYCSCDLGFPELDIHSWRCSSEDLIGEDASQCLEQGVRYVLSGVLPGFQLHFGTSCYV